MLLQDMYDNYWSHGTDWDISGRTNSGGSIKLYGHQRKVQEQMVGHLFTAKGRNHVHLTVRLGFVTQHLWLGHFGKCNRGLHARTLRLRYPKSLVTFPFS